MNTDERIKTVLDFFFEHMNDHAAEQRLIQTRRAVLANNIGSALYIDPETASEPAWPCMRCEEEHGATRMVPGFITVCPFCQAQEIHEYAEALGKKLAARMAGKPITVADIKENLIAAELELWDERAAKMREMIRVTRDANDPNLIHVDLPQEMFDRLSALHGGSDD